MIINYWQNLNAREQWLAGIGLITILFYLLYLFVFQPLFLAIDEKVLQLQEKKETLRWMEQVRKPQKQNTKQPINTTKLLALVGTQLTSGTLKNFPYQLQQIGSGELQLSFDQVPFNLFLSWIWSLSERYSLSIKQLSAERLETPGLVRLTLVIEVK